MKTQISKSNPGKRLVIFAALSMTVTALAMPALAGSGYAGDAYRPRAAPYHAYGYGDRPLRRYDRLNRINRYGVRGRIVAWGRGPLRGCFRVKRTGRYDRQRAIVTVRYCLDGYGQAYGVRGSKRLVRYLDMYRRTGSYAYPRRMSRY